MGLSKSEYDELKAKEEPTDDDRRLIKMFERGDFDKANAESEADGEPDDVFDPSKHSVAEVNSYLDKLDEEDDSDEIERVLAAEAAGKNRSGIVGKE